MDIVEKGINILEKLGLNYEWHRNRLLIWITDPETQEDGKIRYGTYDISYLLDFLLRTGKLKLETTDIDPAPEKAKSCEEIIRQLRARAIAIGNDIWYDQHDIENSDLLYYRHRFKIPGTRYKFYFHMGNVLDTKRSRRNGISFRFNPDELEELERWVAHDERIFAECNQEYSVSQD